MDALPGGYQTAWQVDCFTEDCMVLLTIEGVHVPIGTLTACGLLVNEKPCFCY